jgi:hypothetical protein
MPEIDATTNADRNFILQQGLEAPKLMSCSLVEEYKEKLEKLSAEQGARLTLEKGDDAKDLRKALKAAAGSLNRKIRFPFRGEEGSLSFYLEGQRGRRGRRPRGDALIAGRG